MSEDRLIVGPDRSGLSLLIEGERVTRVSRQPIEKGGGVTLECSGALIEPGQVCAHTHLYSGLAPFGMPAPEPTPENFVQILERVWWRLDRALDAPSLAASARLYVAEALLAGTTVLVDHHESPEFIEGSLDVLADACAELGIRALLSYGATERNGGREEAQRGLAECERFAKENERPLIGAALALHASFTVSDQTIREAGQLCRALDLPMHVHVAEDGADVSHAKLVGYDGPLERLLALDALPPGSILAHGVHLSAEQVTRADELGLWLVQNPRSNRGNAVGYSGQLSASEHVALGTDGYPARMDEERAALAIEAAAHGEDPAVSSLRASAGRELASALFGGSRPPVFEADAVADLRVVDGAGVRHVVVAGRVVVRNRELMSGDLDAIRREAETEAARLWQRMKEI